MDSIMRPEVSNSPFQNASFLLPPHAWAPALIQVTQIAWTAHATRRTRKLLGSYSIHPNSWLRKRNICVNRQSFELSNSRYHPPTPPPCKWAKGVNVRPVDNLVDTFAESHKVTIHAEQGSHSGNVMTMHTKTWVGPPSAVRLVASLHAPGLESENRLLHLLLGAARPSWGLLILGRAKMHDFGQLICRASS